MDVEDAFMVVVLLSLVLADTCSFFDVQKNNQKCDYVLRTSSCVVASHQSMRATHELHTVLVVFYHRGQ